MAPGWVGFWWGEHTQSVLDCFIDNPSLDHCEAVFERPVAVLCCVVFDGKQNGTTVFRVEIAAHASTGSGP